MERVTEFCERRNHLENTLGSKLRVEFSRRRDLKYNEFTNYLTRFQLQSKPFLSRRIPRWSVIDPQQIYAFDHETRAGLQLADVVASAFYQAINRVAGATPCPDYAEALSDRVWRGARGEWFDEGFKVFPYPLRFPRLDDSQKRIFRFYGYPDRMW